MWTHPIDKDGKVYLDFLGKHDVLISQVRDRENQDLRDRLAMAMKELQTLKFNMIEISAEASV